MVSRLAEFVRRHWKRLVGRLQGLPLREQIIFSGLLVGIAAGLSAYVFIGVVELVSKVGDLLAGFLPLPLARAIFPALGGLVAGLLTHRYCQEAKGSGVHNVVAAIQEREGRIGGKVAWVTTLASAATLGSGGSSGAEGPIVQIGAAVGSWVSSLFEISGSDLKMLVAGGAAGGLAAVFSVPLAGVFFVMEVILKDFASEAFAAVVIASVTSTVVAAGLMGRGSYFSPVNYSWRSPYEFLLYALLAMACAPIGYWYERILEAFQKMFDRQDQFPDWVRPGLGGLMVGALGLFLPEVLGTGQKTINAALMGESLGWFAFALVIGKILATSLTLGSGGAGGALMPSLFIGATAGAALARVLSLFPAFSFQPGALALVGMACVFTAAFNAPITAIIMALEISRDYGIIPPVMFACVTSYLFVIHHRRVAPHAPENPLSSSPG